jgi:2-isopropylmalate synthase
MSTDGIPNVVASASAGGNDDNRVRIFDTTLRDGEQSPGCTMHTEEKLRVAQALADAGVDIIEAGFPIASDGDFDSSRRIARSVQGPIIAGLARCNAEDIDRAWQAMRDAARPRIHVFLATSAIHREFKLKMAKQEIVRRAAEGVARARALCADVEFSPEDAARTEPDFLAEVVEAAINAGATTLNIPDTVGYAVPEQYAALFTYLRAQVRGIENVILSTHCHDDLGMAVANSLAGVRAGARQVECTINGIGERAGNAALEEIVMAIRTRGDFFGVTTGVDARRLYPLSRLVSSVTGSLVQPNKAIVGDNAFAHEAGIHQHGVLQHRDTYEIIRAEDVGVDRSRLVLGKHSGRHAFRERIEHLGLRLDETALNHAFIAFKSLADKKKQIFDADIEAIALSTTDIPASWTLREMQVTTGTGAIPTATVEVEHADGRRIREAAVGDGPVDAIFKALLHATDVAPVVRSYRVRSVTDGEDAQGEVVIDAECNGQRHHGRAVNTDVVQASAYAFLDIINRIERVAHSAPLAMAGGAV